MKAGAGKRKGAKFEREVCVALSRWITNNVQDDVFWRAAMSGGRATVAKKGSTRLLNNQVADLSCIDPVGSFFITKFAVECKHLKSLQIEAAVKGKGILPDIWKKLRQEAFSHNKDEFLVMKQNNWPVLLGLHPEVMAGHNHVHEEISALVTFPQLDLNLYYFNDWLKYIKRECFIDAFYRRSSSDRSHKRRIPVQGI